MAESFIVEKQWAEACTFQVWRNEALDKVDEAVAAAQRDPLPDPYAEQWEALSSKHLIELRSDRDREEK